MTLTTVEYCQFVMVSADSFDVYSLWVVRLRDVCHQSYPSKHCIRTKLLDKQRHQSPKMQKAKQAAASFLSKDGKHKTTVDQDVRSAVTEEHIKPSEHENVTTAVDREVHQDHHQTRIQPVQAKETL